MPNDLPPWEAVYQQSQRWLASGVFEAMTQDLRRILRVLEGRHEEPSAAAVFDSRTLQSTPESGQRAGYDGAKRKKGSKVHMAIDTLGHLLSLHVTAADEQDREQVGKLAKEVQKQTGRSVELAYVDQGYTGARPAEAAAKQKIELSVVKLPEAKRGFVLLPRRWVVERSFAWLTRFRRLAKDYERLPWDNVRPISGRAGTAPALVSVVPSDTPVTAYRAAASQVRRSSVLASWTRPQSTASAQMPANATSATET
jgi:transposase